VLAAAVVILAVALVSYGEAILRSSNSPVGIRTVEWLRDHGAAGLVSRVESIYYSLTAPSKGGPGLHSLPDVGYGGAATATARRARARRAAALNRPHRAVVLIHPALPGEGVWRAARAGQGANAPVLVTTLRNQPDYPRVVTGLAWIDHRRTRVTLNPGRLEPAVALPRGPMAVPLRDRARLVATFNSGFKLSDARGGVTLDGHTYVPLQDGEATLVGYRSGRVDVLAWSGGPRVPSTVSFARQNLPLIVNHGRPNPNLSDGPEWGATLGNAILVWRSAVGIDRHGNLIYAAGNDQTVRSLANALVAAGAVRAMELDINSFWTSFITYGGPEARSPANLLPTMNRSPSRYLTPDDRDFFAVYLR
jgi:hypothetical protein